MNQTTNYQLSQWEPTDRILMSDFNADNAKIDAALKTQADSIAGLNGRLGLQLLKTFTSSTDSDFVEVSLSGIVWSSWKAVHLVICSKMSGTLAMGVYLNGLVRDHICSVTGTNHCTVSFFPMYDSQMYASGIYTGYGSGTFGIETKYQNLTPNRAGDCFRRNRSGGDAGEGIRREVKNRPPDTWGPVFLGLNSGNVQNHQAVAWLIATV